MILTTFHQAELRNEAVQKPEECLQVAIESDTEVIPFKLTTGQNPAPAVNPSICSPSIKQKLRRKMRKLAEEEVKRIFSKQAGPSMQKEADESMSDVFFVGFEEADTKFKTAYYYFIEVTLTKNACKVY